MNLSTKWPKHVTQIKETRDTYTVLARKPEWKSRLLGKDSLRMENNIKTDFKETLYVEGQLDYSGSVLRLVVGSDKGSSFP